MSSPKILSFSWGKMEVEGIGKGKDYKLWPGDGRPWDWNEISSLLYNLWRLERNR